jgi:hypothetical protein
VILAIGDVDHSESGFLRRLAPSVFLLARGTRLAADTTGWLVSARGLQRAL